MIKIITLLLSAVLALSAAGCVGSGRTSNEAEVDIEINYWISGFGVDYMNEIVEAFGEKYPKYNVTLTANRAMAGVTQSLQKGEKDTVDLYFCSIDKLLGYTDLFEPLYDVYAAKADGESVTIGEKFQSSVKNSFLREDGSYYAMSYVGGVMGIVYNADIIDGEKYELPNTTDELSSLAIELAADDIPAFIHFQDATLAYYYSVLKIWQAQYAGLGYVMNDWLSLTDEAGNSPSKAAYTSETDGRKAALEALGRCVNPTTVYRGSNSAKYSNAQTYFINGYAAMMVNGAWMQNEMLSGGSRDANMKMMKTPVISSIIDVLPDKSVSNDAELSALIAAIDAAEDGTAQPALKGAGYDVTQADWNRVAEARKLGFDNGVDHAVILNKYSNSKNAAKEFLKYYFSDEGLLKFFNIVHQSPAAAPADESAFVQDDSWTEFDRSVYALSKAITIVNNGGMGKSKLFTRSGLNDYANISIVSDLSASDAADLKTPAQLWAEMLAAVDKNWNTWMWSAGYQTEANP